MKNLDYDHINAVMKRSDEKSPIRKPTNEKSVLSIIDDSELNEILEKKSNIIVSKKFVDELKKSEVIISEFNRVFEMREKIKEKINTLEAQHREINKEKEFCKDVLSLLTEYEKFIQNI